VAAVTSDPRTARPAVEPAPAVPGPAASGRSGRVEQIATIPLPTARGTYDATLLRTHPDGLEHIALVAGEVTGTAEPVLVRIHSECATGDLFGSRRCDCGQQLDAALDAIAAAGRGVLLYERGHEGRGIGLAEKFRAYALQDAGADTVDANLLLGHPVDARDFAPAAAVLRHLGVASVRLLTNNPDKVDALRRAGLAVTATPLRATPAPQNIRYLRTKQDRMRHDLALGLEVPEAVGGRP
jgi:3,4-dihydroxy 2-butanone 4-phosphate synthase/GTP cyclohydrolase II